MYGDIEACKLLLSRGANVNDNGSGWTPLHWASMKGDKDMCALLLVYGADPCLKSHEFPYDTPLDVARNEEVRALLVARPI
jgi:ankyrin repeat protein